MAGRHDPGRLDDGMRFADRADAGRRLADALAARKDDQPVVLGLPHGGVAVRRRWPQHCTRRST